MSKHELVTSIGIKEVKGGELIDKEKIQTVYRVLNRVSENGELTEIVISDMLNGYGNEKNDAFIQALMSDHRTLQQSFMRLITNVIKAWAKTEYFDDRNKATIELAEKLNVIIKDSYLPLI